MDFLKVDMKMKPFVSGQRFKMLAWHSFARIYYLFYNFIFRAFKATFLVKSGTRKDMTGSVRLLLNNFSTLLFF